MKNSAWSDWNFSEASGQLGKMVEHPNQSVNLMFGPKEFRTFG